MDTSKSCWDLGKDINRYSRLGREKEKETHWVLFGSRKSGTRYMCSSQGILGSWLC